MPRFSFRRIGAIALLLLAAWLPAAAPAQTRGPLILAAASLQEAMEAAAGAWQSKGYSRPVLSFAASPALARQIERGAPADLFLTADEQWMDYVAANGLLAPRSRATLLANRLVLVAPSTSQMRLAIRPHFPLLRALGGGRLAMADPDAVPAGRYGRTALERLGIWQQVAPRVARAENVRAALALVERGEAPLGIVYATDARASSKVRVVGLFPVATHPPIRYPVARLAASRHKDAEAFRRFLFSREARAIFARFGFLAP